MTFIDFVVCNLAATLPVLYSVTLTYFFEVKYFKCQYLDNGELAKNAEVCSLYRLIFAIELDHFECCTP